MISGGHVITGHVGVGGLVGGGGVVHESSAL